MIRIPKDKKNIDTKFPVIFGSALLKMSGEPTITYGIDKKTILNENNNVLKSSFSVRKQ